jgi:trans-aconitate methyltransferase
MLDAVGLESDFRVLDLAAGTGDTSILVARRVGPRGSVLAVDISAAMLQEAAAAATREGLANIETLVSDIALLDLPPQTFDAAISRFGLMFLTDVVEGLRRIRRALKPGARLAAAVWSAQGRNPHIEIPLAVAAEFGHAPPEGSPMRRAASLGGPGVFASALESAGFVDVDVRPVPTPRAFESVDAALDSLQLNSTVLRQILNELDSARRQAALSELRSRLQEFAQSDGRCVISGEALLGVASAP